MIKNISKKAKGSIENPKSLLAVEIFQKRIDKHRLNLSVLNASVNILNAVGTTVKAS